VILSSKATEQRVLSLEADPAEQVSRYTQSCPMAVHFKPHHDFVTLLWQASAIAGQPARRGECECPLVGDRGLQVHDVVGRGPNQVQKKRYGSCLSCMLLVCWQGQELFQTLQTGLCKSCSCLVLGPCQFFSATGPLLKLPCVELGRANALPYSFNGRGLH